MYKVFFNESCLCLTVPNELNNKTYTNTNILLYRDFDQIEKWVSDAENYLAPANVIFMYSEPEELWKKFKTLFKNIDAAGGLVKNEMNELLFIYRKGKWDLPKGKVDKGEKPCDTALREVYEETGLTDIKIERELIKTYHIYRHNNELILKKIHWFLINNRGSCNFRIQTEEHIEKASWFKRNDLDNILGNTYGSIKDVFDVYSVIEKQ